MLEILENNKNFLELYQKEKRPIIVYGAGGALKKYIDLLPEYDIVCDKYKADGKHIAQIDVLKEYKQKIYIIVTVVGEKRFRDIVSELEKIVETGIAIYACNNIAFRYDFWSTPIEYKCINTNGKMRVNIVCEDKQWIFNKFADRMAGILDKENIDVMISEQPRKDVDINHHIPYVAYCPYKNDTLMITHVDNYKKVEILKRQLQVAGMGICMSNDTLQKLTAWGIPREKLCYINPAQDNIIKPHKYLIGITHKCHDKEDMRKRATALLEILEGVDARYFRFFIMGAGWEQIVEKMRKCGFETDYYNEFIYEIYIRKMQEIDYFLYMGFDEGTMGYLDALAAGAGTIVTPQGYHLDTECKIDYPCSTIKEFRNAFFALQEKRKCKIDAVAEWNWYNYTQKHIEIWEFLLHRKPLEELYSKQLCYNDGIYSVLMSDNRRNYE